MINYYLLMKPGIILGNLITFAAGFLLGSRGLFDPVLFFVTLAGLGLIIGAGCVFNNCIDSAVDGKMERTKLRPLVLGVVSQRSAIIFGVTLWITGTLILLITTNLLTVLVANVGFFVYVLLYSVLKKRTSYSTLIGSISGAIPPVVGYCAVSGELDYPALIFFVVMVLWQMPHFYAIALWHYKDYAAAGVPLLPMTDGAYRTKVHMMLYILGLIPMLGLFTWYGFTGVIFLSVTSVIGLIWLVLGIMGFWAENDSLWGRSMFRWSLVMINAICLLMIFSKL